MSQNIPTTILDQGWIIRINPSNHDRPRRLMLMVHGWTGDENSMNVFQRGLPGDYVIISPRGYIEAGEGGYGWAPHREGLDAELKSFQEPAKKIYDILEHWKELTQVENTPITMMGFSQGAALTLAFALLYPTAVEKIISVAGFLPYLPADFYFSPKIKNLNIFIAHGIKDPTVDIARAYQARDIFQAAGAAVRFCEGATGHRLSANCFNGIREFLRE